MGRGVAGIGRRGPKTSSWESADREVGGEARWALRRPGLAEEAS